MKKNFLWCVALLTCNHAVHAQVLWIQDESEPKSNDANQESSIRWQSESKTTVGQSIVWEPMPDAETWIDPSRPSTSKAVVWRQIKQIQGPVLEPKPVWIAEGKEALPLEAIMIESQQTRKRRRQLPTPPKLQALNRSIAYSNGHVGPDIGWKVPNGLQWSERWFGDATIRGFSKRNKDKPFFGWNNGDASAQIHLNLINSDTWSAGVNTSIRSVYQGSGAAGGSTTIGEGVSSGFRIAKAIGKTGGIAIGGEQILQWDSFTDTGRNFYLMATNGWWLGDQGRSFPLLIANGGVGTGRLAQNFNRQIGCFENIDNRSGSFEVDNNLCFGPIGSIALAFSSNWGSFIEYNSRDSILGLSANLGSSYPIRLTFGIVFGTGQEFYSAEEARWVFRGSIGF